MTIKECSKCKIRQRRGIITAYLPTLKVTDLCSSCLVDCYNILDIEDKRKVQVIG
jgi:hypothetical protein